jgi:hypothetical protein
VSRTITLVRLSSALRHGCSTSAPLAFGTLIVISCLTCKSRIFLVEPRELEPLASAVQRRHHTLLALSGVCKMAAKARISFSTLFPGFQEISSGCCTAAAHEGAHHLAASSLVNSGTTQHGPRCFSSAQTHVQLTRQRIPIHPYNRW